MLRFGYVRNLNQFDASFAAAFRDAPGAPFTVKGASPGAGAWVLGASLADSGAGGVSYELSYDGEFWNNAFAQTFKLRVSYSF